jgi:hypothetical protein
MKFINIHLFIVALAVGILCVYVIGPLNTNVMVYPTPDNIDDYIWKDGVGTCYHFKSEEILNPNTDEVKQIPVQN